MYLFLAALVFLAALGLFSLVEESWGLLSNSSARTHLCSGFSLHGSRARGPQ